MKTHANVYLVLYADLETGHVLQTEMVGDLLNHVRNNRKERFQVLSSTWLRKDKIMFFGEEGRKLILGEDYRGKLHP
jgi:hypothetical protein